MTRIIQIADIHFGTEDPDALAAFEAVVPELQADALAVCGDLTQRGKRSEFRAARHWLDTFQLPMIVVAGNHDTPLLNLVERVVSPFERHDSYFGDLAGPITAKDAVLVGLNTSRGWQTRHNWAEGSVNLEDLEDALVDADEGANKTGMLICHHPFLSPPQAPMRTATRRGRRASRRLAQSRVRYLLTGHVHAPSVLVVNHHGRAYVAVSAGTLSTRLRETPPSFNLIEVGKDGDTVTAYTLDSGRFHAAPPERIGLDLQTAEPDLVVDF